MQNIFKRTLLLSAFSSLIMSSSISFAWHDDTGYWDYHGSGRDRPYSLYIDRMNYVGYADYAPLEPDYIDGPLIISNMSAPAISPIPIPPSTQINEITVNIPNVHGGFNAVVIKKSGEGFIGPQGEYYPEFPKIFQLQMKYGN